LTQPRTGRAEREAAALRANLRKRKEQERLRTQAPRAEPDQRPDEAADARPRRLTTETSDPPS
jgi:hypothetical protein